MGLIDDVFMPFGKDTYKGKPISKVPSSYLKWCQGQEFVYEKHPKVAEKIDEEMKWRDDWEQHFEDPADIRY